MAKKDTKTPADDTTVDPPAGDEGSSDASDVEAMLAEVEAKEAELAAKEAELEERAAALDDQQKYVDKAEKSVAKKEAKADKLLAQAEDAADNVIIPDDDEEWEPPEPDQLYNLHNTRKASVRLHRTRKVRGADGKAVVQKYGEPLVLKPGYNPDCDITGVRQDMLNALFKYQELREYSPEDAEGPQAPTVPQVGAV